MALSGEGIKFSRGNNKRLANIFIASERKNRKIDTVSKYGGFSCPYFPVFRLKTGKYGPERNSVFGHFSGSDS